MTNSMLILTVVFSLFQRQISASTPHLISFRSRNLYPESLSWDPTAQHFIVGSLRHPTLLSVSDAGVVNTLVFDNTLPANSSFLGVTVDLIHRRVLAVVHPSSALAAYDLHAPHHRLFLATLHDPTSTSGANDVTIDFSGNAFVTNSASNFIWKVDLEGKTSLLSDSKIFMKTSPYLDAPYSAYGLNGVAYNSHGYLLVAQSNMGNLYKVDSIDGTTRKVQLNRVLMAPDGVAMRRDGVLVVVSQHKLYFIKSDNGWSDGVVYDETALDSEGFPTSVTVGAEDRVYVLYGHAKEGETRNSQRDWFRISEVRSEAESGDEAVWVYVLIGFGFAYFLFWRFQMRQLFTNMNKKTA